MLGVLEKQDVMNLVLWRCLFFLRGKSEGEDLNDGNLIPYILHCSLEFYVQPDTLNFQLSFFLQKQFFVLFSTGITGFLTITNPNHNVFFFS